MPAIEVLIVDDIGSVRAILRNLLISLEVKPHEITEAADGGDAIALLETRPFDFVITDWNMPEASGIDVLKRVRARSEKTPVLLLTSNNHREEVIGAVEAGANDYILKPFSQATLSRKISFWLNVARDVGEGNRSNADDGRP